MKPRIAFAVVLDVAGRSSASGDRRNLRGFARVEIVDQDGDAVTARVLAGDGVAKGSTLRLERGDVFETAAERTYFGDLVRFFYGAPPPGPRPALEVQS